MTDWGLIAIRFVLYADLMLLMGLAAFPLYSFRDAEREDAAVLRLSILLTWLTLAGLIISSFGFVLSSASMMGIPLAEIDITMLLSMASETDVGNAWIVRLVVLAAVLAGLFFVGNNQTGKLVLSVLGGVIALATLIWSGHAAATEGSLGTAHRISNIAHIVAAAVWIGGIAAFALLLRSPTKTRDSAYLALVTRSLSNFAPVGTVAVAVIALTGLINGYAIFGPNVTDLANSTYGQLLIFKIVLVGVMLVLAANNRWRLTPALEGGCDEVGADAGWTRLRRSVALEAVAGVGVLFLVSWLGMIDPGIG